ncbi:MAG: S41 family peptidase, partial [Verrucomicrobiia bacterium]
MAHSLERTFIKAGVLLIPALIALASLRDLEAQIDLPIPPASSSVEDVSSTPTPRTSSAPSGGVSVGVEAGAGINSAPRSLSVSTSAEVEIKKNNPASPVAKTGVERIGPSAAAPAALPPATSSGGLSDLPVPPAPATPDPSIFVGAPEIKASPLFPNPGPENTPDGDPFELFIDVMQHVRDYSLLRPRDNEVALGCLEQLHRIYGSQFPHAFPPKPFPFDDAIFDTLEQVVTAISEVPGQTENARRIMERAVAGYVRHIDRFASYNNQAALELLESNEKQRGYSGTGLTLEETPDGVFVLYPLPGEAADLAGVLPGDHLMEIDGQLIRGTNRIVVQSLLRGPAASSVRVGLIRGGRPLELQITREIIRPSPIEVREDDEGVTIRVRKFEAQTVSDLRDLLLRLEPNLKITLDLRSCIGGEFDAGVGVAELFLPSGAEIGFIASVQEERALVSNNREPYRAGQIILLQDRGTASASELLIAALLRSAPCAVESRGEKTFGKGSTQRRFVLRSGGLLTLSDSRMYGPGHISWEPDGLEPT